MGSSISSNLYLSKVSTKDYTFLGGVSSEELGQSLRWWLTMTREFSLELLMFDVEVEHIFSSFN